MTMGLLRHRRCRRAAQMSRCNTRGKLVALFASLAAGRQAGTACRQAGGRQLPVGKQADTQASWQTRRQACAQAGRPQDGMWQCQQSAPAACRGRTRRRPAGDRTNHRERWPRSWPAPLQPVCWLCVFTSVCVCRVVCVRVGCAVCAVLSVCHNHVALFLASSSATCVFN